MGDLTKNFSCVEFHDPHGHHLQPSAALLRVLQRARDAKGKPLRIVSGVRCTAFNRQVGGIRTSQHLYGRAADVPRGYATVEEWKSYGAIGIGTRDGFVIHVDVTPGRRPFVFKE